MAWYYIVAIAVAAVLALCFSIYLFLVAPGKRRAKMERFKTLSYAHRGLHGKGVAENSISAFRAAVEAGYGIELDVHLSSDGELVVFHDDTLDRVTEMSGRVDEKTAEELSKIKLCGTEDTVPTFKDVLELVDGKVPLLVEIKEAAGEYGVTKKTIEMLREYKGEFIIESFNPLALALVKKEMPDVLRGFLSTDFLSNKKYKGQFQYFLLENLLFNFLCRPDFISYNHSAPNNFSLKFVRRLFGAASLAWTVTSLEEEALAYKNGFDGVIFEQYTPKKY